jgi:hypothetical protein
MLEAAEIVRLMEAGKMGVALFPVFESQIPGYEPWRIICGKALARASGGGRGPLEGVCRQLKVKPIFDFYSESREETLAHISEPVSPELLDLLDIRVEWWNPAEGLRTIEALLAYPDYDAMLPRDERPQARLHLLEDLQNLQAILMKAEEHGTRFRLVFDL